jgi:hypothetical protein
MPKLHEGLAIHKDRSAVVKKVMDEARAVFKAATHFAGFNKRTEYYDEESYKFNGIEEKKVDETVPSKLDYVNEHLRRLLDLDYQIETANREAVADLEIGEQTVANDVPVGFLLTIENKFKEYRAILEMIPTQAPGIKWEVDNDQSSKGDIFKSAREAITYLTKKQPVYTMVAPATDAHPAQIRESHDDVRVAKVSTTNYTSTISPAQKSDMLGRCDEVIQAAKRARQRANDVEISGERIADPLLRYIVHGRMPNSEPSTIARPGRD